MDKYTCYGIDDLGSRYTALSEKDEYGEWYKADEVDADKAKDTARIKELEEGLRMVETWWLSSGKYASFGAPGCIFKVRELIKPKEESK